VNGAYRKNYAEFSVLQKAGMEVAVGGKKGGNGQPASGDLTDAEGGRKQSFYGSRN